MYKTSMFQICGDINSVLSGVCSTKYSKAQACFYSAKKHKDVNQQSVISAMSFLAHISRNGLGFNTDHKVFFTSHNPRGKGLQTGGLHFAQL